MIDIRAATPDDAPQIAAIYAPFVAGNISFEATAPTASEMRKRMAASNGLYPWIVATNGEPEGILGYAYAGNFRDRAAYRYVVETSIYLAGDWKQQGVGRLLFGALVDTLRAQDFTQAISGISLPNDDLISLNEALGFRRAGVFRQAGYKNGEWRDVGFWQLVLATPENPPRDPRLFSEVGVVRDD